MVLAEYEKYDAVALAELVRHGHVSARELNEAAIRRIEERNLRLNAVVHTMYDRALARVDSGLPDGPFTGVPFLLKDLGVAYEGEPLTSGCMALRDYVPDYTAEIAKRYERAGLVILGKTNTPEFGMKPATESKLLGTCANPWDTSRTAGGSSGGAAAAVASGMVPTAHASDGGGSIRIPASHCGLFGLKPTRGRTPVGPFYGEGWFGFSTVHALTRSVRDSAALLDATQGPEPGDPYAAPPVERPFLDEVGADPGRLRVGMIDGGILAPVDDPEIRKAVMDTAELLEDLGHRVEGVELPVSRDDLVAAFVALAAAEVANGVRLSALAAGLDEPDPEMYEAPTWVLSIVGRVLPAEAVSQALFVARRAGRILGTVMEEYDVLLSSTMGIPPWPHHALDPTPTDERLVGLLQRMPLKPAVMLAIERLAPRVLSPIPNTPLFNMTGQPAMSVPLHWTPDRLPVGVQFAGRFGDEATLFRLAAQLEDARPWFDRRPPGF